MSRAKAVFIPPAKLVVVARSSYPSQAPPAVCPYRLQGVLFMVLLCNYSGAFMLSTMLMRRTCRRMTKQTTTVNTMVSATASR